MHHGMTGSPRTSDGRGAGGEGCFFPLLGRLIVVMFASREDAGRRLGAALRDEGVQADLVLGLPRGGVVVAAEVAHSLELPMDVLIVRKIGHPLHREFAVGALAEGGVVVLDEAVIGHNPIIRSELADVIQEEKERLQSYQARFHPDGTHNLTGKSVLLVDDGLATGATTEAGVLSVKKQNARRIIVAAPVGSTNAADRLERVADEVRVLLVDPEFDAVGRYYDTFSQTTDEEVLELLRAEVHRRA
jgi:putative phosphoribosyl transferase